MRFGNLASVFAFVASTFCVCVARATDDGQLGIVKEKPLNGPFVETDQGYMVPYAVQIPGTEIQFEMVPIPGGEFRIGTPESEAGHLDDEAGSVTVRIDPFWMGKTEVTWAEYDLYTSVYSIFKAKFLLNGRRVNDLHNVDAVTSPTPVYAPMIHKEFGGEPMHPAVTMTPFAAKQYTKWISKFTGAQYRLPTEAEWEYAARAGSDAAYCFGPDVDKLAEFACYSKNHPDGTLFVGSKKPNAFGLYDMHGNVWEWVVDGYKKDGYQSLGTGTRHFLDAIQWPTEFDQRVARGGGFMDSAERCRSGAKLCSREDEWKTNDPQAPPSPWWFTDDPARMIGMRLARSLKPLPQDTISKFWEIDHSEIRAVVEIRLKEGTGAIGLVIPEIADEFRKRKK